MSDMGREGLGNLNPKRKSPIPSRLVRMIRRDMGMTRVLKAFARKKTPFSTSKKVEVANQQGTHIQRGISVLTEAVVENVSEGKNLMPREVMIVDVQDPELLGVGKTSTKTLQSTVHIDRVIKTDSIVGNPGAHSNKDPSHVTKITSLSRFATREPYFPTRQPKLESRQNL